MAIHSTEDLLAVLFDQIPLVEDKHGEFFKVKYGWGNENSLNQYIIQTKEKYPLIWLVEGTDKFDSSGNYISRDMKLFIAKNSDNVTNTNPTIWVDEFNLILNPILAKVIMCLTQTGICSIEDGYWKVTRMANYSENNSNSKKVDTWSTQSTKTIDNWNVIVLEAVIKVKTKRGGAAAGGQTPGGLPVISTDCIKPLKFE